MIVSAAIQLFHNRTPVNSHFLRAAFISPNTQMKCWKLDRTVSSCRETKACGVKGLGRVGNVGYSFIKYGEIVRW